MRASVGNVSHLQISSDVYFGAGSLFKLSPPPGRALLLKSPSLPPTWTEGLVAHWHDCGTETIVRDKPPGEPVSNLLDALFMDLPTGLEAVIGIGGGSVLDFAKALAILAGSGGAIADYEFGIRKIERVLPLYLAPTTCGSGSEVTPYCVINNRLTGRKFTLSHPALRAVQAAVDPEALEFLPDTVILSTALDAFIHCLEAVLSRADSRLIRPLAEAGLAIGWRRLPELAKRRPSPEVLDDLARLSLLGGISIAHSRTGLIHTMSVAFAEFCDAPHGLLNARLLPHVLSYNLAGYAGLLRDVVQRFSDQLLASDIAAYQSLCDWLISLIGSTPPAAGVEIHKRLDSIVRRILQDSGLPGVNHMPITSESLRILTEGVADASR